MIKKVILTSLVIAHLLLILVISTMVILAETYPFQPGELLYPVQCRGTGAPLPDEQQKFKGQFCPGVDRTSPGGPGASSQPVCGASLRGEL